MAVASFSSKILGFLRDTVLARQFGAGPATNAYFLASYLPLTLFAAVGVAITNVFIPTFSKLLDAGGDDPEVFAARVNGAVTVAVAAIVVVLELGAGVAATLMNLPDKGPERSLTITMVRIMSPLILFYAWSGVVGGVLNVRGVFGPNAAMGIPQNLIIVAAIFVGSRAGGDIRWVAWGSLVGTLTTYLFQLPALRRARFRVGWRFDFARDPRLRAMALLAAPAAVTALAQQLGIGVDRALGQSLGGGLLSDLTYAGRLQLLAYSILGMSIATVLYPTLSAAGSAANLSAFRRTFARGLTLVNFVTVPVTIAMFSLRTPLVRVLFQHHMFTAADTRATAFALAFLTLGTFGYGWQDYLNRAFFALQDTRTPMLGGFLAVSVNVVLDFILLHPLRQGGLALGTASGWTCAAVFLALRLRRRMGLLGGRQIFSRTARMAVAALAALVPAALAYGHVEALFGGGAGWLPAAAALVAVAAAAAGLYFGLCALLRVPEAGEAVRLVRGALKRLGGPGAALPGA